MFIRIMLSTVESSDALIRIMLSTVESSDVLIRIIISYHIISYHIFIFTKHAKKHINKHVKGENSQKAKKGQKRAITQLGKKTTANLPTKESNKRKKKLTLPIPSKPSMKRNQQHIKHTIIQCWRTRRTHSHSHRNKTKQKQNIKTSQAPKIKKRYIFTLLERKYVVLQLLSKCFDIKRQFNFFR